MERTEAPAFSHFPSSSTRTLPKYFVFWIHSRSLWEEKCLVPLRIFPKLTPVIKFFSLSFCRLCKTINPIQEFFFESTLFSHKRCPLAELSNLNWTSSGKKTSQERFWDLQALHEDLVLVKFLFSIIENNDVRSSFESKKRKYVPTKDVLVLRIMCYSSILNFGLRLTKIHADIFRKY